MNFRDTQNEIKDFSNTKPTSRKNSITKTPSNLIDSPPINKSKSPDRNKRIIIPRSSIISAAADAS